MLEHHTTLNLSADEINALGLKEVHRIQEEMRTILAPENIINLNKNVSKLVQELSQDNRFYYPQTDEGRKQCLEQFRLILKRCQKELYDLFDLKPNVSVKIQPIPKHEEEEKPGAYYRPPSLEIYEGKPISLTSLEVLLLVARANSATSRALINS